MNDYEISDAELECEKDRVRYRQMDALWKFKPRCPLCKDDWHGLPDDRCPGSSERQQNAPDQRRQR